MSKQMEDFFNFLWPFQKTYTLQWLVLSSLCFSLNKSYFLSYKLAVNLNNIWLFLLPHYIFLVFKYKKRSLSWFLKSNFSDYILRNISSMYVSLSCAYLCTVLCFAAWCCRLNCWDRLFTELIAPPDSTHLLYTH